MKNVDQLLQGLREENKKAKDPSYFLIHQVRYAFILKKIHVLSQGKALRILDVGCFPYHVGKVLEQMGHEVYGISSIHEPIANKRIAILNIETEKSPFKNNFFDMVLCNEVVEHLPHSPVMPLRELHRITKKGGFLMLTTPNIVRSINRVKLLFGKNILYSPSVFFENGGKGNIIYHRHNREYTLYELVDLVKKTGWVVDEAGRTISYTPSRERMIPDPFFLRIVKWVNYIVMLLFPPLQDTLFIIGRKV